MSTDPTMVRLAFNGATMGTRYSVVAYAAPALEAEVLDRVLHQAVTDVDAVMSNWKPDSAITRLNEARTDQWIDIPESLVEVLGAALAIEAASDGAFDIGVGSAVGAWGFGPLAGKVERCAGGSRPVTRQALELDRTAHRARKHAPLSLDLSGIAKGYGVDRLGETLATAGLSCWLASIDGEVRAGGAKPDGSPWAIGIERPVTGRRDLAGVVEIADMAVATSGTYRQFREVEGKVVSHTIDPRTGVPFSGRHASVTVLAPSCMEADAWATAILVDGAWPPNGFAKPEGIDALLLNG